MALTFGTLLSSQGADAHHHGPFGQIRGNPSYVTRSEGLGQIPASNQLPTWSPQRRRLTSPWRVALGGIVRPAPRCLGYLAYRSPFGPMWLRASNNSPH